MARCLICHRQLKDAESIARQLGPVCYARVMQVAKEERERRKAKKEQRGIKGQISIFEEVANG